MNQTKRRDAPATPDTDAFVVLILDDMGAASDQIVSDLTALTGGAAPRVAQSAEDAIIDGAQSRVVVLVRDPEVSLAAALSAGPDTAKAQAAWLEQRRALIDRIRRARRRVTLLDASVFATADADIWQALARRLDVTATVPPRRAPPIQSPDPLFVVSAALLIERDPVFGALANDLRVATLGNAPSQTSAETVAELILNWRKVEASVATLLESVSKQTADKASMAATAGDLRDEASLLRDNLALGMQEMDRLRGDLRATAAALAEQKKHADASEAQSAKALAEARLTAQTLEQSVLEAKDLAELAELLQENARLQMDAGAAMTQREHAQLLEIKALKARVSEAVLLKATNEALEHRLAARAEVEGQRAVLFGAQVLADANALGSLQAERDDLVRRLDDELHNNSILRAELDKVFQSKSWRLTRPLRTSRGRIVPPRRSNTPGPSA